MRKVKLTLLSLLALGAMSLASCTGAQGEKGDKGDQGERGPQGEPGENGEDGEDGSLWYTGEGVPSADLGKEGDMYLDTSSNDIYQKESSGWVLKTNIQGDKGEDGEDGENGRPGSDGSDGKTAWSNTILPSEGGYVTASVGSAIVGEDVTFYIHPNETFYLETLTIWNNGTEVVLPESVVTNGIVSYTLEMLNNGFVVLATFSETAGSTSYYKDGILYENAVVDGLGNIIQEGTPSSSDTKFDGGDGVNEPLVISNADQLGSIDSEEVLATNATKFAISGDVEINDVLPLAGREETELTLNSGSELLINTTPVKTEDGVTGYTSSVSNGQSLVIKAEEGASEKPKLVYNEKVSEGGSSLVGVTSSAIVVESLGSLAIEGVEVETNNSFAFPRGDAARVDIIDSKITAGCYGVATNAITENNHNVIINIENSEIISESSDSDNTAVFMNVPGELNIKDSTLTAGRQALIVRGGSATIEDTTINYYGDFYNNDSSKSRYDSEWSSGNEVPCAAIVVGNKSSTAYDYKSVLNISNVTINTTKVEAGSYSLLETGDTNPELPYLLYAHGYSEDSDTTINMDQTFYDNYKDRFYIRDQFTSLNVDGESYNERNNVFYQGELYSSAYYLGDTFISGTKVEGISFPYEGKGDGSSYDDALLIEDIEDLNTLKNESVLAASSNVIFELNVADTLDISTETNWTPIGKGTRSGSSYDANSTPFKGIFNGNNKTISGLNITSGSGDAAIGLFGVLDGGKVENLNLTNLNINVSDNECAGGIVGLAVNGAEISNCVVGNETDDTSVFTVGRGNGGIVGRMTISGKIENCINYVDITGTDGGGNTGGIVGAAYYNSTESDLISITNCHNYGNIKGIYGVGGIVGLSCGDVSNCSNNGEITTSSVGSSIGGIVGEQQNSGSILNCVNNSNVTNNFTDTSKFGTGGIVGWVRYSGAAVNYPFKEIIEVSSNENIGSILGAGSTGGIIGHLYEYGLVQENVNKGNVRSNAPTFVSGIVGTIQKSNESHFSEPNSIIISNNTVENIEISGGSFMDETVYNNITNETWVVIENNTETNVTIVQQENNI